MARKKASVEQMLKTAMQNQLDGVKTGVEQLRLCLAEVDEVDKAIKKTDELLKEVPALYAALESVRVENARHSQYATAIENLKHIFTVQASVAKTLQWIEEDKLLHAHQCLSDMEHSRDDLLFELHKLPNQSIHDRSTLKRYFEKVDGVSDTLQKKIRVTLQRTLNSVRKEPTVIVTCLRIIEREEKSDQFALQQQKQTGFLPPGRPKEWRKKAMETLRESVNQRIEGSRLENRDEKLWLVRDLEMMRQLILEDLRVVKSLCVPCFPPHYNIMNEYVKMYHSALSKYLEGLAEGGLEGNEYVSLLSWVMNTYPSGELMGHQDLDINLEELGPLMKPHYLAEMEKKYLQIMERNYVDWMTKTLETEKQDWQTGTLPETDDVYYHTSAPVIIFQMIAQNLQVTNTINAELTFKALVLSIKQVIRYGSSYRQSINEFKERYFKDRSQVPFFTQHFITITNNCQQMLELAQEMKQRYWPKSRTEHYGAFELLLKTFQELRDETASCLLEEAFLDLESHFNDLFTVKWLQSTASVDTILATLEDYFQDYNHLRVINFEHVINEAQRMATKKYLRAMLSKRLNRTREECQKVAAKIQTEVKKFKAFFERIAPNASKVDAPLDIITKLAPLINCDIEMMILDLHTVLSNYPSMTEDHLVRLFYFRNDFKTGEVRERVQDAMRARTQKVCNDRQDSIFREIVFSDKLW